MATWGPLLALVPLWVAVVFAPGFAIVRRWPWSPPERLCAAVALSLFLVNLAVFAIHLTGWRPWGYHAIAALCIASAAYCRHDWARLLRVHSVRRMLAVLLAMLVWATLCLGLARHYAGGVWGGDWTRHWRKVVVFTTGPDLDLEQVKEIVIERAGMMNLVATEFTGVLGLRFDVFQVAFCWLNVLPILGCCLLAGMFARRGGRRLWAVAAVVACLPMMWVNATYTWTKLLSVFYTLLGTYLYLRGIRKGDRGRIVAAFACFAIGILVHYTVLPYALVAGVHYVLTTWWRRPAKWTELALILGVGLAIGATWFGWVVARYGFENLTASNNTLIAARNETAGQTAMKMARNAVWNVLPHFTRYRWGIYEQASRLGYARDYMFLLYQTNMLMVTGTVTGILAAFAAYRRLHAPATDKDRAGRVWAYAGAAAALVMVYVPTTRNIIFDLFPKTWMLVIVVGGCAWLAWAVGRLLRGRERGVSREVWFWRMLIFFMPVATGLALDVPSDYGAAHIFFHAWALMGATLAAVVVWELPRWVRWALGAGLAIDFALGVWLQFHLERAVFSFLPDGRVDVRGLHLQAGENWAEKTRRGLVFLGDHLVPIADALEVMLIAGAIAAVAYVVTGGWKKRGLA